jgi:hypothetical protein
VPYGIYDVAANTGWVNVGTDHDTAAFAVESIRRWWNGAGQATYPTAGRLLITADAGGSNGYRTRTWKTELARFAAEAGLSVTVCHLPPGTSKWNRIEHQLFSHITMNWRGRPLTSHEVIVESIAPTTTKTGLTVHAELDTNPYPTGIQVSDDEIAALPITRHRFHGDWNYTLHPKHLMDAAPVNSTSDQAPATRPSRLTQQALQDPELTGMTRQQLSDLIEALTPALEVQREQVLRTRRGHERLVAPPWCQSQAHPSRPDPDRRAPPAQTRDHGPPRPALRRHRHDHQPRETRSPPTPGSTRPPHQRLNRPPPYSCCWP